MVRKRLVQKVWLVAVIVLAWSGVSAAAITPSVSYGLHSTHYTDGATDYKFSSHQLALEIGVALADRFQALIGYHLSRGGDLTHKDDSTTQMTSNNSTMLSAALFYDALRTDTLIAGPLVAYNQHAWKPHESGGTEKSINVTGIGVGGFVGAEVGPIWLSASYTYQPSVTWADGTDNLQGTGSGLALLADVFVTDSVSVFGGYVSGTGFVKDDFRLQSSGFNVGAALYF